MQEEGLPIEEAVRRGSQERLAPVLFLRHGEPRAKTAVDVL
jgi:hypothetical protein